MSTEAVHHEHNVSENDDKNNNYEYDIWDEYPQYKDYGSDNEIIKPSENSQSNNKDENPTDLSDLPPNIYCDLVTTIDKACFELSLLEIWLYDEEIVATLTQQDIIDKINTLHIR